MLLKYKTKAGMFIPLADVRGECR